MNSKVLILILGLLASVLLGACGDDSPVSPASDQPAGTWDKDGSRTSVVSATLFIRVAIANSQTGTVHRITAPWSETTTTYNTFGGAYDPAVYGTTTVVAPGWLSIDVTGLVQEWASGVTPNHGMLLDQTPDATTLSRYSSREAGSAPTWW